VIPLLVEGPFVGSIVSLVEFFWQKNEVSDFGGKPCMNGFLTAVRLGSGCKWTRHKGSSILYWETVLK
jgi:hypothetical protein